MSLSALMHDYAASNLWANQSLVDWLKTKPLEIMDREVPSSFSSLKQTLVHIWNVETVWLGHLKQVPVSIPYGQKFGGPVAEVFSGIVQQSEEISTYVHSLNDSALEQPRSICIPNIIDCTLPAYELIQHCLNHSTYHRGQITTIGRLVGLTDAPMTDYMFYLSRVKPAIPSLQQPIS